jgi:hypothetical protein
MDSKAIARRVEVERSVLGCAGTRRVAEMSERVAFVEPKLRLVVAEGGRRKR